MAPKLQLLPLYAGFVVPVIPFQRFDWSLVVCTAPWQIRWHWSYASQASSFLLRYSKLIPLVIVVIIAVGVSAVLETSTYVVSG
jgi:hypothetical protein